MPIDQPDPQMEWTVELDAGGFVRVTTRGRFNVTDHIRMTEDILGRPFWRPGMAALFDHRALDLGTANYQVMSEASRNHLANDDRIGDGRAAILMGGVQAFGSARQFELLIEAQARAKLRVFLDPIAAEAWVRG